MKSVGGYPPTVARCWLDKSEKLIPHSPLSPLAADSTEKRTLPVRSTPELWYNIGVNGQEGPNDEFDDKTATKGGN